MVKKTNLNQIKSLCMTDRLEKHSNFTKKTTKTNIAKLQRKITTSSAIAERLCYQVDQLWPKSAG